MTISFGNHQDHPITVRVTLTPFSHATAYPAASKTITITVNPYNPFPEGMPTSTKNITVVSPASGNGPLTYRQGAALEIKWTDTLKSDPCVNLYLFQKKPGGGQTYVAQIAGCLGQAASGSYTWTIPRKYSGSEFRILIATPGGTSNALSAPSRIVP